MLELVELQIQGKFKPQREQDVLSIAIGSKEHGGRVRGLSSKLSIKDGLEKDRARYRSHDRYKEEIMAAAENAMQARYKGFVHGNTCETAAVGATYVQPVARGGAAADSGHAPSGTWPSESGMCTEQCHLNHISAIPGGYHNEYYPLFVALFGR